MQPLKNWAGNITYSGALHQPATLAQLQHLITHSPKVRALGTRHSFHRIADTPGVLVETSGLEPVFEVDTAHRLVRVSGHLRYGDIAAALHERGWALANLASLPHISIAGAIATGTHGSGDAVGSLAAAVAGVEIVTADGTLQQLRRGDPAFPGVVVGLGAFGVIVTVELDIVPAFEVSQHVYHGLPLAAAVESYDAVTALGYSVSLFTTWARPDVVDQLWVKRHLGQEAGPLPAEIVGARAAKVPSHPLPGMDPVHCTPQLGEPGPWYDRLPHFRLEFTPSHGDELQSEYLIPREKFPQAMAVLQRHRNTFAPLLLVSEIRSIAADNLWLSPAFGRDTVGIHFTWKPREAEVLAFLPQLEADLLPLGARPHWGKLFTAAAPQLAQAYPRFNDAVGLMQQWDPQGRFVNEFLARTLGLPVI